MLGFANRFGFRPLRKGVIKMVKGSIEGYSKTERFFRVALVRAKKARACSSRMVLLESGASIKPTTHISRS